MTLSRYMYVPVWKANNGLILTSYAGWLSSLQFGLNLVRFVLPHIEEHFRWEHFLQGMENPLYCSHVALEQGSWNRCVPVPRLGGPTTFLQTLRCQLHVQPNITAITRSTMAPVVMITFTCFQLIYSKKKTEVRQGWVWQPSPSPPPWPLIQSSSDIYITQKNINKYQGKDLCIASQTQISP